jgi:hypothetical protein
MRAPLSGVYALKSLHLHALHGWAVNLALLGRNRIKRRNLGNVRTFLFSESALEC